MASAGTSASEGAQSRLISRRALLRGVAAGAAGIALVACGGAANTPAPASGGTGGTPAASTAGGSIKRGGTITVASVIANPGWDVHLANANVGGHSLAYECLLRYDLIDEQASKFELKPGLAESWQQPDPQTIVLKLRQGVKFHDGSDFNAEVVKWNLERIKNTTQARAHTQFAPLDTVEAVDASTVRLKLKTPSAAFLLILSDGAGLSRAMISKAQFEKLGAEQFNLNGSGTGPMRIKSFQQNDRAIMEPFPDYWGKGEDGKPLPYFDQFVDRYVPEMATALVELQSGGVDVIESMPPRDVASSRANPNLAFRELPWSATQYLNLGFNLKKAPFDNLKVRQAVLYSMDRESMVKAVGYGSGAAMLYSNWLPGSLGYDESIPHYKYDPEKAKQVITEAGFPNGIDFELKYIQREPDTTAIQLQQQAWSKIGIRVKLVALERLAWVNDSVANNFEVGVWRGNMPADPDLLTSVRTGGGTNYSNFSDPEIDKWMQEAGATLDTAQRAALYAKVNTRIQEQAYVGSGFQVPTIYGHQKKIKGLRLEYGRVSYVTTWKE